MPLQLRYRKSVGLTFKLPRIGRLTGGQGAKSEEALHATNVASNKGQQHRPTDALQQGLFNMA